MMIAKFGGVCARCKQKFPAGAEIEYDREAKQATHVCCPEPGEAPKRPASRPVTAPAAPQAFSVEDQLEQVQKRLTALEAIVARMVGSQGERR